MVKESRTEEFNKIFDSMEGKVSEKVELISQVLCCNISQIYKYRMARGGRWDFGKVSKNAQYIPKHKLELLKIKLSK